MLPKFIVLPTPTSSGASHLTILINDTGCDDLSSDECIYCCDNFERDVLMDVVFAKLAMNDEIIYFDEHDLHSRFVKFMICGETMFSLDGTSQLNHTRDIEAFCISTYVYYVPEWNRDGLVETSDAMISG